MLFRTPLLFFCDLNLTVECILNVKHKLMLFEIGVSSLEEGKSDLLRGLWNLVFKSRHCKRPHPWSPVRIPCVNIAASTLTDVRTSRDKPSYSSEHFRIQQFQLTEAF